MRYVYLTLLGLVIIACQKQNITVNDVVGTYAFNTNIPIDIISNTIEQGIIGDKIMLDDTYQATVYLNNKITHTYTYKIQSGNSSIQLENGYIAVYNTKDNLLTFTRPAYNTTNYYSYRHVVRWRHYINNRSNRYI